MKRMLVIIFPIILFASCGGGGATCDFDISAFTNGTNATVADSYWSCQGAGQVYDLAFYDDGTGFSSSGVGAFTWEETACREVHAVSAIGGITITNIQGSIASGIATFTQRIDNTGEEATNSCTLVTGSLAQIIGEAEFKAAFAVIGIAVE